MKTGDETIYDSEETVYDSEDTVPDSERTVLDDTTAADGATILDDATVLDDATMYDGTRDLSQAQKAAAIEKGQTLLDTYHIESDAIEGGMGKVWRVHHRSWNVDLAMKQPKASLFQTGSQKANFIHECEAWINLGLHPHIVSCYYVREIGGIPTIFSEWMDGGSLKNIIEDGSLYADGAAERILDIAIQFARGLHYAHEQGLIHQDVKPDNLLMNKSGDAKVADFGIAKARAALTAADADLPSDATMFSASGGYTPAYCSIEQVNGEKLTRRTDVYSWAVSVMEMYLGGRPWVNGVIAGTACESYFSEARVAIPESMKSLLKECMNADEAKRPHDFAKVEARLLEIYRSETGRAYSRISPKAAADTADSLNNRALSFWDLGKPEEAEKCWEKAVTLDSNQPEAVYNYTLRLWRSGKISNIQAERRMIVLHQNRETWRSELNIAKLHMECGNMVSAISILTNILDKSEKNIEVQNALDLATENDSGWRFNSILDMSQSVGFQFLSPAGSMAITYDYNKRIFQPWDLKTGKVIQANFKSWNIVGFGICCSPNGRNVICGNALWDIETDSCLFTFHGNMKAVCFSPDGKTILTGSDGMVLKLWDSETGECLKILKGHSRLAQKYNNIESVSFSPDGSHALSGSTDKTMKLWDINTGECIHTFTGHSEAVCSVCFSPDSNSALSVDSNGIIKLWNIKSGDCLYTISGGGNNVCFSPDGKWAISTSMMLFDVRNGKCIYIPIQSQSLYPIQSVCFCPDGRTLLYADKYHCYQVMIPKLDYQANWLLSGINDTGKSLENEIKFNKAMEEAGAYLETKNIGQAINALQEAASIPGFSSMPAVRELSFKIGRYCRTKGVLFFNLEKTYKCSVGKVGEMALSPDGKLLASVDLLDKNIKLWDIQSGQQIYMLIGHKERIYSICFSTKGDHILSTSSDNTVKIWDTKTGECFRTIDAEVNLSSACISPDGKYVFVESRFSKLWDIYTGKCLRTYKSPILSPICFSPDGRSLLTKFGLEDVETGKRIWSYKWNYYSDVCMSADGRYLLTSQGANNDSIRLRDLRGAAAQRIALLLPNRSLPRSSPLRSSPPRKNLQ